MQALVEHKGVMHRQFAIFLIFLLFSTATVPTTANQPQGNPKKLYCAGVMSTLAARRHNTTLAKAIEEVSHGKYACVLPQDLHIEGKGHKQFNEAARNACLKAIFDTDGIVVNLDGKQPGTGTVVEFIVSRCLNKPAVLFKTDTKYKKDDTSPKLTNYEPSFSLMLNHYPNTAAVRVSTDELYKRYKADNSLLPEYELAKQIVAALDQLDFTTTPKDKLKWCASMFGFNPNDQ
jgi:nucleoside 2-deoxyribosyltransferase